MTTRKESGERQVALLRGVNVGRAKRVAMADLRALVSDLGYREVGTLLNSGNVVFTCARGTARESAARIEEALEKKLGVTARVFGLSAGELAAVIARNPLLSIADNPSRLMVAVLADPSDRARIAHLEKQDVGRGSNSRRVPRRLPVVPRGNHREQAQRRVCAGPG